MSAPAEARASLAAALAAAFPGVPVFDHLPEALPAPCLAVLAAPDWISRGGETLAWGQWRLRLGVLACVPTTTNQASTGALEDLVWRVCEAIDQSEDWWLDGADQPEMIPAPAGPILASQINATTNTTLN
jgi:hypothetical protein